MTDATELDEAAIRARVEAATEEIGRLHPDARPGSLNAAQRDRIAAAVADLPAALDENARLRAALREAETKVQRARSEMGQWRRLAHERTTRTEAAEQERDEVRAEVGRVLEASACNHDAKVRWFRRAEAAESALAAVEQILDGPIGTSSEDGRADEPGSWFRGARHLRVAVRAALDGRRVEATCGTGCISCEIAGRCWDCPCHVGAEEDEG